MPVPRELLFYYRIAIFAFFIVPLKTVFDYTKAWLFLTLFSFFFPLTAYVSFPPLHFYTHWRGYCETLASFVFSC